MSAARLCAISVDLDEMPNYFGIHAVDMPPGPAATLVYDRGVDRLVDFAASANVPLTLFTIGSDVRRPEAAAKLRDARSRGHEIANHTLDHRYDLTRLDRDAMRAQVVGGADAIERAVGERPVGFRAPGYVVNDALFRVLEEAGVTYDSSVFPCPPYVAIKALYLASIALRGKTSDSIVDTPMALAAPTRPYRVGKPYWRRGAGILELPVQVTRGLRLPFIGTSVTVVSPRRAALLAKMCVGEPLVNLELHGIDVLEAEDGLEALSPVRRDMRVRFERKLECLAAVVETLRAAGYSFVTLREASRKFASA